MYLFILIIFVVIGCIIMQKHENKLVINDINERKELFFKKCNITKLTEEEYNSMLNKNNILNVKIKKLEFAFHDSLDNDRVSRFMDKNNFFFLNIDNGLIGSFEADIKHNALYKFQIFNSLHEKIGQADDEMFFNNVIISINNNVFEFKKTELKVNGIPINVNIIDQTSYELTQKDTNEIIARGDGDNLEIFSKKYIYEIISIVSCILRKAKKINSSRETTYRYDYNI